VEEFRAKFSHNKIIPIDIEMECLVALSYYPELKDALIEFRWKDNLKSTMRMIPTSFSFFFKSKIKYIIYMNLNASETKLKINELSFNAKVGWLGHELSHVTQCHKKKKSEIAALGLKLISKKFIAKHERKTDIITIKHDLGYALYEGSYYVFNNSNVSKKYLSHLKKNYLNPEDILYWIQQYKKGES